MTTDQHRRRYDQCDDTCTTDCGHCKGQGRPSVEDVAAARPDTTTTGGA